MVKSITPSTREMRLIAKILKDKSTFLVNWIAPTRSTDKINKNTENGNVFGIDGHVQIMNRAIRLSIEAKNKVMTVTL